ncbi:MAG: response regulator [Alphaproteobacteria bacterium]|nr:response regulator [Alphaproteobacteria bacterium]
MSNRHRHDFSQLSVLVVDDCRFMRMVLERMLEALGITKVRFAADGFEAWDLINEVEPDVIVCDWEMQPEDGPSFVRRVRLEPDSPCRYVAIIMLTGYTERSKVMSARDFGITEFLAKPVAARSLHARLVQIVDNPRPFVRTSDFFGPCRRRLNLPGYDGPERRGRHDEIEI